MIIQVRAEVLVHEGQLEQFRVAMAECRALVLKNEPGTNLDYDWFLSGNKCDVLETYTNSAAFIQHLKNVGGALGRLLQSATLVEVRMYGKPSEKLMAFLAEAGLTVKVYAPL